MSKTIELDEAGFDEKVLAAPKPVLIDFWADWCRPCRAVAAVIEELASEYDGRLLVGTINVDDHPRMAAGLGIRSIPTMLVFSGGREKERMVGSYSKSQIVKKIESVLAGHN